MKKICPFLFLFFSLFVLQAQTDLNEAVDFQVKTTEGATIKLFPLLDESQKIVVIDFFSTTCGPCQEYAPDFQNAFEMFDSNNGNVFFMGINYDGDNDDVDEFDSIFGLTYPSVSGIQGGGDNVYETYNVASYPTVIIITPDHQIVEQFVWPPTVENIVDAVYSCGGIVAGNKENFSINNDIDLFPNPVHSTAYLSFSSKVETDFSYKLIDLLGNLLFNSEKLLLVEGINQIKIPVEGLKSGIYFVIIKQDNAAPKTLRFIVSK